MAIGRRIGNVPTMNTSIQRPSFQVLIVATLCAAIVLGFSRTFYLRFLSDLPPLTQAAHVHGILSTLWLILHFMQARLIAARQFRWHRALGVVTAIVGLIALIQVADFAISSAQAGRVPPGRVPREFLSVSLGTTFMFGLFLIAGLALRKRREWHQRLMLLATIVLLMPAIGRLDTLLAGTLGMPRAVLPGIVTAAFVLWASVHDWRTRGRVHPALLYGGALLLASLPLRRWLGTTEVWQPFAEWVLNR
jgi:hypothetical protein